MYLVMINSFKLRRVLLHSLGFYEEGKQWMRLDVIPAHLVMEGNKELTLLLLRTKRRYKDNVTIYRVAHGGGLSSLDLERDYDSLMDGISTNA